MTNLIAMLAAVIMQIESGGEPNPAKALGDYNPATGLHEAIGVFQMHDGYVVEANRLEATLARRDGLEPRTWTSDERLCPEKSLEMFKVTMRWHYERGVTDPVTLAAKHHRPYGEQCPKYREKIRRGIEQYERQAK